MASPTAEVGAGEVAAPEPVEGKGKDEKRKRGGLLGRIWRGLFGGREDYEKRLQYLSKEEATVHARMCRWTQFSRHAVRNLIVLSIFAEQWIDLARHAGVQTSKKELPSPDISNSPEMPLLECDTIEVQNVGPDIGNGLFDCGHSTQGIACFDDTPYSTGI